MKFGSTWLKATLLGSAMLAMGFVSAQEKITLTIEANGAEYKTEPEKLTELEKKSKVVLTVTKTPEGKEVESVTCDDAEAKVEPKDGKYEITLGEKNAKVTIKLKDKAPAGEKIELTIEKPEGVEVTTKPEDLKQLDKKSKVELTITKLPEGKEVESVTCDDAEAKVEPKDGKYEITLGEKNAKVTITLKDKKAPEGTIPVTAEFNNEGGDVYWVDVVVKDGKLESYNLEAHNTFPINAVKGAWYGVVVKWKEGYEVEKFDLVLTRGKDVKTQNLLADNLKNIDKFKSGEKIAAYGATLGFGDKTTVTAAKYVVSFKKGTTPKPGAVEDNAFAAVSVYPNPFADKLIVNEVAEASRVTLVNAQGVVLRSVAVNGANQIALDVTDVPAGIYMVVVENGAARRAFKVVK